MIWVQLELHAMHGRWKFMLASRTFELTVPVSGSVVSYSSIATFSEECSRLGPESLHVSSFLVERGVNVGMLG